MTVHLVLPVVIQNDACLELTLGALRTIREPVECVWVLCNRLHGMTPEELTGKACEAASVAVTVVNDHGRSVAGAWNEGARRAFKAGAETCIIMASDARPAPNAFGTLAGFRSSGVAAWSGCQHQQRTPGAITDGLDCSFFAITPRTFAVHGFFDECFIVAYFEDNDYYARIILGGEHCRVVHDAAYLHLDGGSRTIKLDPEAAHHVKFHFEGNRRYFAAKWGVGSPAGNEHDVLQAYHKTPFNAPRAPLFWWGTPR